MPTLRLEHDPGKSCYRLLEDGKAIGRADYTESAGQLILTHTEVDPSLEGKGYGSRLAEMLLDRLREERRMVVPACSFIAGYIARHPEFEELVAAR